MVSLTSAQRFARARHEGDSNVKWSGRKTLTVLAVSVVLSWAIVLTPFFV